MALQAQLSIGQLKFNLVAETAKDLFQNVAQIQELFEAETACGCCQSEEIRFSYREVGDYKYYELVCRDCGAQFKFGQKKQGGGLFPKRTEGGKPLENGGWSKYEPSHDDDDTRRPRQQQASRPDNGGASRPASAGRPIPEYPDWDAAEKSELFGRGPLRVAGVLYHVPTGKRSYEEAPQDAQGR